MNEKKNVIIIAHRGANSIAPENTMKAFHKAIEFEADYIEFDVHMTKDREIVIMHDSNTYRTTGRKIKINEAILEDLKQLDCGEGEKIPTLRELIGISKGKIGLQCEIKAKGITDKVVDLLREEDIIESTLISSFYHKELIKIKNIEPKLKVAALIIGVKKKKMIQKALDCKFYALHPLYKFVNKSFIDGAHENNIKVNVWTVNDMGEMRKLIDMGVDGIITNDVEAALNVLNR